MIHYKVSNFINNFLTVLKLSYLKNINYIRIQYKFSQLIRNNYYI